MCLLLVAIDAVPDARIVLLGNRDEYHGRASAAAAAWAEDARIAGGRDLVAGGAWLAVRSDGRFATVTNLRSGLPARAPRSRGALVRDFVLGELPVRDDLDAIAADVDEYGPFNLVAGDRDGVFAFGSADAHVVRLEKGLHAVSNGPIGVHWPKTERLRDAFIAATRDRTTLPAGDVLLDLLADETRPEDVALPDTGVGIEHERMLAPVFIRGDHYGTRASTLVVVRRDGGVEMIERRFAPRGIPSGETKLEAAAEGAFVG